MDTVERMRSLVHLMHMIQPILRKFKSRAQSHHESFYAQLKVFWCLDVRFCHGIEKHKIAFEAVCVICQYQLENGSPLFDA
jgi:uncharacterized membrane protein